MPFLVPRHPVRVGAALARHAFPQACRCLYAERVRRRERILALAVSLLGIGVGYQAIVDARTQQGLDRTSVVEADGTQELAGVTGVLNGDEATGCLWLEHAGRRTGLVLEYRSAGVNFSKSPPTVETVEGVVARFGQTLSAGGGFDARVARPECSPFGTPFRAWSIDRP